MSAPITEFNKRVVEKTRYEALLSILDKMRGFAEHLIGFPHNINKFNNTGVRMQASIYHMTLKSHFITDFCSKTS